MLRFSIVLPPARLTCLFFVVALARASVFHAAIGNLAAPDLDVLNPQLLRFLWFKLLTFRSGSSSASPTFL